jgi:hypothetical protein
MKVALVAALISLTALTAVGHAMNFSAWGTAQKIDEIAGNNSELNTPFQDGCPIQSPDGLSLYIASNRPGVLGFPPGEHGRTVGCAREPRCAGELGRRRLLSDPGQGRRALLRQPGGQCG